MNNTDRIKGRNGEIDCWKFVFSIVILLHHSYQLSTAGGKHIIFGSGALAVDFSSLCPTV